MGSVVQPAYKKKLKMIRSELFALLSISQANAFVTMRQHMDGIKDGVFALASNMNDIE